MIYKKFVILVIFLIYFMSCECQDCGSAIFSPFRKANLSARIDNGEWSNILMFPWVVSLRQGQPARSNHFCGGFIIDKDTVLTAAHCVIDKSRDFFIVAGNDALSDLVTANNLYYPKTVRTHFGYGSAPVYKNDVAIIKVNKNFVFSAFLRAICLPNNDVSTVYGKEVYVAGWGTIKQIFAKPPIMSNQLRHLKVRVTNTDPTPYWSWRNCPDNRKNINYCLLDVNLQRNSMMCDGDDGGPLMYNLNGKWYAYGILSFQSYYCTSDLPGYAAIIPNYLDWINSNRY